MSGDSTPSGHGANVATIGSFDGVHAGHQRLVGRARELADASGGRVVVLAFDPHPAAVLRPGAEPARLTGFEDRVELLRAAGADEVVRLVPDEELLGTEADAFIRGVRERHGVGTFVEGPDFRFGRRRAGDVAVLKELGRSDGFGVEIVGDAEVELLDQSVVRASSTLTRWLIEKGRVADAAAVLGRPYAVEGTVVRGARRGRELGFPTANTDLGDTPLLLPSDGVYAGRATLPDGREFHAAISVGTNPTFDGQHRTLEPHLLGAPKDGDAIEGLDEYGWRIRVEFDRWLRDQMKFGSLDDLIEQMRRDCDRAAEAVGAAEGTGL